MITAILIDDDFNLRNGMNAFLKAYAPEISIIGEADSVASGIKAIQTYNPQVVFLDIQMNDGTGFDILEQLTEKHGKIASHIVFITAYEEYAIKAFRFSALDYLLKPVDPQDLKKVISKIKEALYKNDNSAHIDLLLNTITKKVDGFRRIALSTADGMHLFDIKDIIRCESQGNYTKFVIKGHKSLLISKTLKEYEDLLTDYGFERIHQSHLINLNELKSFMRRDNGYVIMSDGSQLPVSPKKKDRLQKMINRL